MLHLSLTASSCFVYTLDCCDAVLPESSGAVRTLWLHWALFPTPQQFSLFSLHLSTSPPWTSHCNTQLSCLSLPPPWIITPPPHSSAFIFGFECTSNSTTLPPCSIVLTLWCCTFTLSQDPVSNTLDGISHLGTLDELGLTLFGLK